MISKSRAFLSSRAKSFMSQMRKSTTAASMTNQDVVVRPARHEDYAALMEMGDVLHGTDYLPSMYHRFIDDPEVFPFVAVSDLRPVGFALCQLLDGGVTSMFRGARVHKDLRDFGVQRRIFDALEKQSKSIRPPIQRITVCTGDHVNPSFLLRKGLVEVTRKRNILFSYNRDKIKRLREEEKNRHSEVKEMTVADLECLFKNQQLIQNLLPNGFFFNRYVIYRPLHANIKHLINDYSSVFATTNQDKHTDSTDSRTGCEDVAPQRNLTASMLTQIDMISCSQSVRTMAGHAHTCEIYCRSGDITSLPTHIRHHVTRMAEVTSDNGVLVVTFPDYIREDDVVPLLSRHGVTDVVKVPDTDIIMYETSSMGDSKL